MREGFYVVRLLEIRCIDDSMLVVTDYLRDNIEKPPFPILEARGCVVFFDKRPHMIFQTNDNRAGLSVIVASKVSTQASHLTTFMGVLSGSTSDGKPFQRHCIVIKDTEAPTEAIVGQPQRVSATVSPEDPDQATTAGKRTPRPAAESIKRRQPRGAGLPAGRAGG
jgi:hypothetical protein